MNLKSARPYEAVSVSNILRTAESQTCVSNVAGTVRIPCDRGKCFLPLEEVATFLPLEKVATWASITEAAWTHYEVVTFRVYNIW